MLSTSVLPRHAFISYASIDRKVANQVAGALTSVHVPVWFDARLEAGDPNYDLTIRKAVKDAFCLIVLASPHSAKSKYVLGEIQLAKSASIPIYPVWIAGEVWEESVMTELIAAQRLDLRDERFPTGVSVLQQSLSKLIDAVFPPSVNANDAPLPNSELYVTIAHSLYLRTGAFHTVGHLLDEISRAIMFSHPNPVYGQGWLLGRRTRYSGRYARPDRLLAPLRWLSHRTKTDPIAVYDPEWLYRTPGSCGLEANSHWDVVDLLTTRPAAAKGPITYGSQCDLFDELIMGVALSKVDRLARIEDYFSFPRNALNILMPLNHRGGARIRVEANWDCDGFFDVTLRRPEEVEASEFPFACVVTAPTYQGGYEQPGLQGKVMVEKVS
jgi:hypothetical protein